MPILFKIFVFLLFKQGLTVLTKSREYTDISGSSFIQYPMNPNYTILSLQGDTQVLDQAIDICQPFFPSEITRDENTTVPQGSTVVIRFEKIADENRSIISRQLILQLAGRVMVEWRVDGER